MPLYMTQAAYTPEAWRALVRTPEDREAAVRELAERMGARVVAYYNSFGEYDVVVIVEAPDEVTATALVLAALSAGHLRASRTTPLLTTAQAMEAMRRAGQQAYRAPQGLLEDET